MREKRTALRTGVERTETVNDMRTIVNDARDKLERECAGKFDKYGEAMKRAVKEALLELCRQDEDFALSVVRGGSFEECMKDVVKKVKGNSISDLEAFRTAVKHYEPEADVEFQMALTRGGSEQGGTCKAEGKIYDLLDFL